MKKKEKDIIWYFADGERPTEGWGKKRSPLFMPKWAARIWLEVTDIRVERLQDISEEDAIREGIGNWIQVQVDTEPSVVFKDMWDSINAKRGYSWESNPWVFVYDFRRI